MKHPIYTANYLRSGVLPDKEQAGKWLEEYFRWLFCIGPQYAGHDYFLWKEKELGDALSKLLEFSGYDSSDRNAFVSYIKDKMISIHQKLEYDLQAIFDADPAARSRGEVLACYPGFFAIAVHRLAHELWLKGIPVLPRMFSEYVHGRTGIDIHPGAKIGSRFFIDHGTGIVVGETASIGNNVKIYQGVTLGALSVSKAETGRQRHPSIGNDVTIYANATILGGDTFVGDGCVIGGNVWITHSVPSNSMVYHKSEATVKSREVFPEPLNFVI